MWSPTHVQVTVQRAKGLLTKGKNGTNNCFVTIALGKEKYQTSVRDKASQNVEWHEECELAIPDQGNKAELILTCLHHNNLGIDEFLGQITLPLRDMDAYDRPRSKWFKLQSKPGQEKKDKDRGELEVRINFTVKAGSLNDLSKKEKHKSSFNQLASSVGGSLLSIGTLEKKKGLKKFATSIGSKLHLTGKKKDKKDGSDSESFRGSIASIGTPNSSLGGSRKWNGKNYLGGNTDPGVADDGGEIIFDKVSHRGSNSSITNGQEYKNNVTNSYSPQNGISNTRTNNPEIQIIQENINFSSPSSTPLQNRKSFTPNLNQLNIERSDSLRRNSWGKPRIPLPIPEKSEDNQIEDTEVELRVKGVPILNETRNSNIEVPETHKPKPRKFILGKENVEDDFSLDNLSVNSSPFSSITSQSFYDYNPDNDSHRASRKLDMDVEENDFYGSFNRADSKRRASRKKSFRPLSKENESDKQSFENLRSRDSQNIEEPENYKPRPRSLLYPETNDVNRKINSSQISLNSSRNSLESLEEEIMIPQLKARSLKNLKVINTEKVMEENIAVEYEIAEKYEKIDSVNVVFPSKIAQVFETRNEETISNKGMVVEIKQAIAPLTVEVEELKSTIDYNLKPHQPTTTEKYSGLVKSEQQVSSSTIQSGLVFKKENMEMAGAINNPSIKISKLQENDLVYGENENEYHNSSSSINFEIRDLKNEENTPRISVSNIRSMFEQNSSTKSSPSISPRHSLTPSKRNSVNINWQPQQSSNVSINLTQSVTPISKQVFESTLEYNANHYTSMARFEKANVKNKSVESVIAQEIDQFTEENNTNTSHFTEVIENVYPKNISVERNIAQVFEIRKEENFAVECSVPEIYENSNIENIAIESHIGQLFETQNEECIAVNCSIPEVYENSENLQHIAVERNIAQVFEVKNEENIAVECSVPDICQNSNIENIAVESHVGQLFETRTEECFALDCTVPEVYENSIVYPQNIAVEQNIAQVFEVKKEENIAMQCSVPDIYENSNIENIAIESYIAQLFETQNEECIAVDCTVPEVYEHSKIQNIAIEKEIMQTLATYKEENIAIESSFSESYNNTNLEYIATDSYIPQVLETRKEENIAVQSSDAEPYENAVPEHILKEFEISQNLEQIQEENFAIEYNVSESFENANIKFNLVEQEIVEIDDLEANKAPTPIPRSFENSLEQNIVEKFSIPEVFEKVKVQDIAIENQIVQFFDKIEIDNIAIDSNVRDVSEVINFENIANEYEIAEINNIQINPELIESFHSESELELNFQINNKNLNNDNKFIPIPRPRSPFNIINDDSNLNQSSSNILQMTKNKEDLPEIKKEILTNTQKNITTNNNVNDESDYESVHSEPELKTNIEINIDSTNEFEEKPDSFESKLFKLMGDYKRPPMPRPRNPNSDILNSLTDSSSSDCSSLENFNYMNDIAKKYKGNQDPGVIEDDDEFVFDKLSHKSSGSSINLRGHNEYNNNQHRIPSPVMTMTKDDDIYRTNTIMTSSIKSELAAPQQQQQQQQLPPPAKPPRNPSDQKLDEWEKKLYGNHLDIGNTDSLKRRSWGNNRIPLKTEEQEEDYEDVKLSSSSNISNSNSNLTINSSNSNTSSPIIEKDLNKLQRRNNDIVLEKTSDIIDEKINTIYEENHNDIQHQQQQQQQQQHQKLQKQKSPTVSISSTIGTTSQQQQQQQQQQHLSDSDGGFKIEKKEKFFNKSPPSLLRAKSREILDDFHENNNKTKNIKSRPRILPRSDTIGQFTDDTIKNPDDAKEIREKLKKDYKEISEKTEKIEKKHKFGKFKYFNKKVDRSDSTNEMGGGIHGERHNPIGHENFNDNENSLPELSQELLNKYEGKSREDIILLADSLEKDVIMERNRVKELEEYLDNLLLRVMETHPKILQNPYRTASTKSG